MRQSPGQHDPHRCGDSAAIIHFYLKERIKKKNKINGFLLTCFAQQNCKEKEIHLLSETEVRLTTKAKVSHHIQGGSLQKSIQSGNVTLSFFFPADAASG